MIRLEKQMESAKNEYPELFEYKGRKYYTISMHFRLGDYKYLQDNHKIIPYQYYESALEFIIDNIETRNLRILYFCEEEDNDIVSSMVSKLLQHFTNRLNHQIENIYFIKVYDNVPDWKQLLLMACCDSNIIANSTFSWFGAYFNRNLEKKVCYPSVWFGPILNYNYIGDMFPSSWKQIES